jgi:hypothetical protein
VIIFINNSLEAKRRKMKKLLFLILISFSQMVLSDSKIPGVFTFSLGAISTNFSENPDQLKSTDDTATTTTETPYTGTASAMPIVVGYEHFPNLKRAYFIRGVGPLLGSTPDRYFSVTGGVNFYFGHIGSNAVVRDFNFEMRIVPKFRYYAGPSIGVAYLVYNTKSATKNDTIFEIGGHGGVLYTINPIWGLRAELGAARGIGVLVSATIIKILLGATYNLGN